MALDMATSLTIKANVVGEQQLAGLKKGLGGVEKASNKTSTAMTRLKQTSGRALTALRGFIGVVAVAGLAKFAKGSIDAADAMSKLSQRTGIAAPMLDKFRKVAELSDTSIESLERAFPALTKNMDMAMQKAKGPAFEAFQRLGVSVKDQSGNLRDADAVMLDIADRFQNMADGSEKAALASAVFGTRIGSELIPLLNSGGDAVRNMSTSLTQDFADRSAAFNDSIENLQETLGDLFVQITTSDGFKALMTSVQGLIDAFANLPGPVQQAILGATALAAAFVLLAPAITTVVTLVTTLSGIGLGATIAGWLGAVGPFVVAIKGLAGAFLALVSGPVGIVALIALAGVAIFTFRDEIGNALKAVGDAFKKAFDFIGDVLKKGAKFYMDFFVTPVLEFSKGLVDGLIETFKKIGEAIKAPFMAVVAFIKNIVNGVIGLIEGLVNNAISAINRVIAGANRLPLVNIPFVPTVNIPRFAKGGVVDGPTLAMIGEGGESEYIVPQSKATGFAKNWMAGRRGIGAIPGFADGGVVNAKAGGGGVGNTTVQVTTGPVLQQDGQNYVTVKDLEGALKQFGTQIYRNQRSYGGRRFQGVAG